MTTTTRADFTALRDAATDGVITVPQLFAEGLTASKIASRCRPEGPWRRILPGVILLGRGEPTRRQQLRAAVAYAGPRSVITGVDALYAHGVDLPLKPRIRLLVPATRRVLARDFLDMDRTEKLPDPVYIDGLPFAPPPRAAIDAARRAHNPDELRAVVTLPVYYGLCSATQLRHELDTGNQRGSAAVRDLLRHLGSMGGTYAQGLARNLMALVPLPAPSWNVTVCDLRGKEIGTVDGWWDEVALGWQFGAQGPGEERPKMEHLALTAAGIILVRTPPDRLREDATGVTKELVSAFSQAARRKRPSLRTIGMMAAA